MDGWSNRYVRFILPDVHSSSLTHMVVSVEMSLFEDQG